MPGRVRLDHLWIVCQSLHGAKCLGDRKLNFLRNGSCQREVAGLHILTNTHTDQPIEDPVM